MVIWHRLRAHGIAIGADARCATQLSLLSMAGELTASQVTAGFKVAEIYGKFERAKQQKRSTASPSYQRAFGDPNAGEDQLHIIDLVKLEKRIQRATNDWKLLQAKIEHRMVDPRRARELLERVCVEDRPAFTYEYQDLRYCLNVLAGTEPGQRQAEQLPSIAVTARRPPRAHADRPKRAEIDKAAWMECTRQMLAHERNGLAPSQDELETMFRSYLNRIAFEVAKGDREKVRTDKQRRRA